MAKEKRASWFKLFLHQKPLVDALDDESVGKGFKAALAYFATGEVQEMDTMTNIIFQSLRPYVEEAVEDFQKSVENGRRGGRRKPEEDPLPMYEWEEEPPATPF